MYEAMHAVEHPFFGLAGCITDDDISSVQGIQARPFGKLAVVLRIRNRHDYRVPDFFLSAVVPVGLPEYRQWRHWLRSVIRQVRGR